MNSTQILIQEYLIIPHIRNFQYKILITYPDCGYLSKDWIVGSWDWLRNYQTLCFPIFLDWGLRSPMSVIYVLFRRSEADTTVHFKADEKTTSYPTFVIQYMSSIINYLR